MWTIRNQTPFPAQGYFVRDRDGAEHWVVAVRASFHIRDDGLTSIRDEQSPVRLAPEYRDDDSTELAAEADICPFRPKTDFILQGVACQPDMAASREIEASIAVGRFRKRARVFGRRRLRIVNNRPVIEGPELFGGIGLTWRNSLGGKDAFADPVQNEISHPGNPVGKGWTAQWSRLPDGAEIDLPLIENPDNPIEAGKPLPAPHGFGALQPHWLPRRDRAGTFDDNWRRTRHPLLPEDFDEAFHQAAPEDQVLELRGGEEVQAINLHPDGPFSFRLPQLILEARTRIRRETVDSRFRLISAGLDTSAKTVDMVWNTHVPCNGRDIEVESSTVRLRQMAGVSR